MTEKRKKSGRRKRSIGGTERLGDCVMVTSNRALTVSGCKRISEYSDTRVRLLLREFELTAVGAGLTVHTYCGDEIEIRGRIEAVYFGGDRQNGGEHGDG